MNISEKIKSIDDQMRRLAKQRRWIKKHGEKLALLPESVLCADYVDFDNLPHAEVIKVIRTLGGKWSKRANSATGGYANTINYETVVDGVPVRCYAGKPPPSCRIIEVEELIPEKVIPAHTIKVKKMVCKPELSAEIAIASGVPVV
jgi:hypothetical protein